MSRDERGAWGHTLAAHLSTPGRRHRLGARLTDAAIAILALAVPLLLATLLVTPAGAGGVGEASLLLAVTCLTLAAAATLLGPAVLLLLGPAPTRGPVEERIDAAPGWAPVSCPRTPSRPRAPGRR
ncbi:hypothetical protein [Mobilicoccus pelagius]|uniref:Uncharacterized protein n=1 Tax=Mobilicoccus pelagius NBRC 104925 TaxID=1089455 RepID=H5UUP3_9MICO|nr:hypothetical protein [Mobilicoccus pelagius]GAB49451.1 hypothetical protein MOPEL_130_00580 [Mobilicoccus pelagius NBRC 104925]